MIPIITGKKRTFDETGFLDDSEEIKRLRSQHWGMEPLFSEEQRVRMAVLRAMESLEMNFDDTYYRQKYLVALSRLNGFPIQAKDENEWLRLFRERIAVLPLFGGSMRKNYRGVLGGVLFEGLTGTAGFPHTAKFLISLLPYARKLCVVVHWEKAVWNLLDKGSAWDLDHLDLGLKMCLNQSYAPNLDYTTQFKKFRKSFDGVIPQKDLVRFLGHATVYLLIGASRKASLMEAEELLKGVDEGEIALQEVKERVELLREILGWWKSHKFEKGEGNGVEILWPLKPFRDHFVYRLLPAITTRSNDFAEMAFISSFHETYFREAVERIQKGERLSFLYYDLAAFKVCLKGSRWDPEKMIATALRKIVPHMQGEVNRPLDLMSLFNQSMCFSSFYLQKAFQEERTDLLPEMNLMASGDPLLERDLIGAVKKKGIQEMESLDGRSFEDGRKKVFAAAVFGDAESRHLLKKGSTHKVEYLLQSLLPNIWAHICSFLTLNDVKALSLTDRHLYRVTRSSTFMNCLFQAWGWKKPFRKDAHEWVRESTEVLRKAENKEAIHSLLDQPVDLWKRVEGQVHHVDCGGVWMCHPATGILRNYSIEKNEHIQWEIGKGKRAVFVHDRLFVTHGDDRLILYALSRGGVEKLREWDRACAFPSFRDQQIEGQCAIVNSINQSIEIIALKDGTSIASGETQLKKEAQSVQFNRHLLLVKYEQAVEVFRREGRKLNFVTLYGEKLSDLVLFKESLYFLEVSDQNNECCLKAIQFPNLPTTMENMILFYRFKEVKRFYTQMPASLLATQESLCLTKRGPIGHIYFSCDGKRWVEVRQSMLTVDLQFEKVHSDSFMLRGLVGKYLVVWNYHNGKISTLEVGEGERLVNSDLQEVVVLTQKNERVVMEDYLRLIDRRCDDQPQ